MLELGRHGRKLVAKTAAGSRPRVRLDAAHARSSTRTTSTASASRQGNWSASTSTARSVWTSGSQHRFGLGPYLIADGLIFVLNDDGRLTLAEATPAGYQPLAQAQVLDGHDAWGPMALAAGRLSCAT